MHQICKNSISLAHKVSIALHVLPLLLTEVSNHCDLSRNSVGLGTAKREKECAGLRCAEPGKSNSGSWAGQSSIKRSDGFEPAGDNQDKSDVWIPTDRTINVKGVEQSLELAVNDALTERKLKLWCLVSSCSFVE